MKLINFNYKKLDEYKPAIDDGFIARDKISKTKYMSLGKHVKDDYFLFLQDLTSHEVCTNFKEKDWEVFKCKVKKVFEG